MRRRIAHCLMCPSMPHHLCDYFIDWSHLDQSSAGSDLGTENRVCVVWEAIEVVSATLVCKTSQLNTSKSNADQSAQMRVITGNQLHTHDQMKAGDNNGSVTM